jgi:hypothetical protein
VTESTPLQCVVCRGLNAAEQLAEFHLNGGAYYCVNHAPKPAGRSFEPRIAADWKPTARPLGLPRPEWWQVADSRLAASASPHDRSLRVEIDHLVHGLYRAEATRIEFDVIAVLGWRRHLTPGIIRRLGYEGIYLKPHKSSAPQYVGIQRHGEWVLDRRSDEQKAAWR